MNTATVDPILVQATRGGIDDGERTAVKGLDDADGA